MSDKKNERLQMRGKYRRLRATHFEQLMTYLEWAEREGTYYGNRSQFDKRHGEVKQWLENIINSANDLETF